MKFEQTNKDFHSMTKSFTIEFKIKRSLLFLNGGNAELNE